ncbi:InlB B-repeat-containing protein [Lactococcus lactis]|uniref:InlB B-repeat-containing protein n=1 Tax=Lactococcus lactis TaxID=1358 RepID=UPI00223C0D87|nr:InlB B-repeat-containing protein [Lactococcus lactis]
MKKANDMPRDKRIKRIYFKIKNKKKFYASSALLILAGSITPIVTSVVRVTEISALAATTSNNSSQFSITENGQTSSANQVETTNAKIQNTITFDSQGGTVVPAQTVVNGSNFEEPAIPLKSGYQFLGWNSEPNGSGEKYYSGHTINSDITLYGEWTQLIGTLFNPPQQEISSGSTFEFMPQLSGLDTAGNVFEFSPDMFIHITVKSSSGLNYQYGYTDLGFTSITPTDPGVYTIEYAIYTGGGSQDKSAKATQTLVVKAKHTLLFESNGGSMVSNQSVDEGLAFSKPSDPTKDGYDFGGWYTDNKLQNPYNFSLIPSSSFWVYAKWIPKSIAQYSVSYESNGGTKILPETVNEGEIIKKPISPVREGYEFSGWYTNQECTSIYDFSQPLTDNLVLYAKWNTISVLTPEQLGNSEASSSKKPSTLQNTSGKNTENTSSTRQINIVNTAENKKIEPTQLSTSRVAANKLPETGDVDSRNLLTTAFGVIIILGVALYKFLHQRELK